MSRRNRVCTACTAAFLALLLGTSAIAPAQAAAKSKQITGKLSQPGFKVIALAADGKATSVQAKPSFKLRVPAKKVTLHLRAANGTYAGPIVVGRKGKLAILGVKAGAKLGKVKIRPGYAVLKKKLAKKSAKKWVDTSIRAQAIKGVPIGAGKVGLVRSTPTLSGTTIGDNDLDGIPNSLDIDDDGDLVLDDYDTSSAAVRAAQFGGTFPDGSHLQITTSLGAEFTEDITNANAGSTLAQIAAGQQHAGHLNVSWAGFDPGTAELDCGSLVYCKAAGTGRFTPNAGSQFTRANAAPFPECCDADHDGLGTLTQGGPGALGVPGGGTMAMYHGATSDQIHAGDVLIARGTVNGTPVESASSVGFVYATFPVVAAYDDGQGNSATITYPRDPAAAKSPVRAGPGGDVVLRLTLWRPQRPRTAGDPGTGAWMDVGNLAYMVSVGGSTTQPDCSQGSFSGPDANLRALTSSPAPQIDPGAGGFADVRGDQPANPANTLSFTLNLSDCLRSKGQTMQPGGTTIGVTAIATGHDQARFFTSSWFSMRLVP